jgi:hypothetical protein
MKITEIITESSILETANESQILNILARRIASKIVDIVDDPRGIHQLVTLGTLGLYRSSDNYTKKATLLYNVAGTKTNSPKINDMLMSTRLMISMQDARMDGDKLSYGVYDPRTALIRIFFTSHAFYYDEQDQPIKITDVRRVTDNIASTLVHEMTHALDYKKSGGRAFTDRAIDNKSAGQSQHIQYLRQSDEINARFQQVLLDIATIVNQLKSSGFDADNKTLPTMIKKLFAKYQIDAGTINNQQYYNRLLSRTYAYFQAELTNPKQITTQSMMKGALNKIFGRPTAEIK